MKKTVRVLGLSFFSALVISACTGGAKIPPPIVKEANNKSSQIANIQGTVRSTKINVDACQLYLYAPNVTRFADAFDAQHPDFVQPDVEINGTAPITMASIDSEGRYLFANVHAGNYQVLVNCITASGVQDESQLSDDPIQYQGFVIPNPEGITPALKTVTLAEAETLTLDFIDERVKAEVDKHSNVTIAADITDSANYQGDFYDMWKTVNRISPRKGAVVMEGLQVNIVRMLGGINKKVNRKKTSIPDLDYDVATYNKQTGQYEYNFAPLLARIDRIVKKGIKIHQLVLDQPPWAFQTGYTFIAGDKFDGVNFLEKQRVSKYGNSLPPKDKVAYHAFLKATIQKLIDVYGKELVLSWRFRIGSEIETPNHWYGTEQDFVEHFANSVRAIRAVLPEAKVGLHTRHPHFVYKNGTVTNYKGEPIKSFHKAIIEYCFDNNIKYDFWGVSIYPFINKASSRDPKTKFKQLFEPLVNHPKWQQGTVIDLEEYQVITKMGGVPGYALITADSPQADTFNVALTDEFQKHGIDQVFQWDLRKGVKPWRMDVFTNMIGQPRVKSTITTDSGENVDTVGSFVVSNAADNTIQAVTYHYDPLDMEAVNDRNISLAFVVEAPAGTKFRYRKKLAAPEHHAFNSFMKKPKASTWLINKKGYDKYGDPKIVLNKAGKTEWEKYQHANTSQWTQWQTATTVARDGNKAGSLIKIASVLPLFSFESTQIKL